MSYEKWFKSQTAQLFLQVENSRHTNREGGAEFWYDLNKENEKTVKMFREGDMVRVTGN